MERPFVRVLSGDGSPTEDRLAATITANLLDETVDDCGDPRAVCEGPC